MTGAERLGARPYVVFPDRSLTFQSILAPVAAIAHAFRSEYGIRSGDRVAVAAANRVEYVLSFWAATVLGAVTVALNGWWTGPEMARMIQLTDPKLLLGDDQRLDRVLGLIPSRLPVVSFDGDFDAMEIAGAGGTLPQVQIHEDDPYVILFTSGTTGPAKGAVISHRSTIHFGLATQLRAAESMARLVAAAIQCRTRTNRARSARRPCSILAA